MNAEKNRKVVIIDNSLFRIKIIKAIINANIDYIKTFHALNCINAYEIINSEKAEIVLFSGEAKDVDRSKFFNSIKERMANESIKIVFLNFNEKKSYISQALLAGVEEYLIIPCTPNSLARTIKRLLNPSTARCCSRYNLKNSFAFLMQKESFFKCSIINLSIEGILCEMKFSEKFNFKETTLMSLSINTKKGISIIDKLESRMTRMNVVNLSIDDVSDEKIDFFVQIAFKFTNIPLKTERIMQKLLKDLPDLTKS